MINLVLNPKEVNILMQALRIAKDTEEMYDHAKRSEIERLLNKLNKVE